MAHRFFAVAGTRYVTDIPDMDPPRPGTSPAKAIAAGIELPVTPVGDGWMQDIDLIQTKFDLDGKMNGMETYSDWLTGVPPGFRSALTWVSDRYGRPPILITENGMDRKGEWAMSIEDAVHDGDRIKFYEEYLAEMVSAVRQSRVRLGIAFIYFPSLPPRPPPPAKSHLGVALVNHWPDQRGIFNTR